MNFKYSYAVSLGSSCFTRRFIETCKMSDEYLFFDWIGSSMWAINELLQTRFKGIDQVEKYQPLEIKKSDEKKIITHKDFYLRFLHDFPPFIHARGIRLYVEPEKNHLQQVIQKYRRRADRFLNVIQNLKAILFIRIEEEVIDRISYPKYAQKQKNELQELFRFTEKVKELNPELDFEVLFFSKSFETKRHVQEHVFVIGHQVDIDWKNCAAELTQLVQLHSEFLAPLFKSQ